MDNTQNSTQSINLLNTSTGNAPVQPNATQPVQPESVPTNTAPTDTTITSNEQKAVEPTPSVSANDPKLPDSAPKPHNITSGMNLMPTMSQEEVAVVVKKSKFNVSGAAFLVVFAVITILVLGANILFKQRLNSAKQTLGDLQSEYNSNAGIIRSNNEILDRIDLLNDVERSTYSPKQVLDYWESTINEFGEINSIKISNELEFEIEGNASTLYEVAQLWHLLSVDQRIDEITLLSVAAPSSETGQVSSTASFSFRGTLNYEYFTINSFE